MKKSMEELFQEAARFDEGEIYQTPAYSAVARNRQRLYERMRAHFDPATAPLLEEYTAAMGDEMDLENRHFFAQGYLMGRREAHS